MVRQARPVLKNSHIVSNPLSGKFGKSRLSRREPVQQSPSAPAISSLSPQHQDNLLFPLPFRYEASVGSDITRSSMATSPPDLPAHALRLSVPVPEPTTLRQRQITELYQKIPREPDASSNQTIVIDDSEDQAKAISERPDNAFSNTNYFQASNWAQQHRQRQPGVTRRRNRRRSRSPVTSSSESEGVSTPESLEEVSYPNPAHQLSQAGQTEVPRLLTPPPPSYDSATAERVAAVLQEEQDWQLAQLLQDEENTAFDRALFPSSQRLRSAHDSSKDKRTKRRNHAVRRNSKQRGTREEPIDILSDSDNLPAAILRTAPPSSEPMELDGNISNGTNTSILVVDEEISEDANVARMLQEQDEEREQQVPLRDCAVCDERYRIGDMPALMNCTHRPETCADCYEGWISSQLNGSSWREAKCPVRGCEMLLTYQEIQQYASRAIFQQYGKSLAMIVH